MEWRDEGIIIGGRRHGETSLILEVMTRCHGRHLGVVKGGRSKRMLPLVQPGNGVEVTWRARLEEHLGLYLVETTKQRAADLMRAPVTLQGLNLVLALLRVLAEREPHASLHDFALDVIEALEQPRVAAPLLVRFEALLLAESGFGIDLASCAATGTREDLAYVSPKSARAVSRDAGAPYKDRLLPLPGYLVRDEEAKGASDIADGFRLTGFFLARDIFEPRGLPLPDARNAYLAQLRRVLAPTFDAASIQASRRHKLRF